MREIDVAHLVELAGVGQEGQAREGDVIQFAGLTGGAGEIGFDGVEKSRGEVGVDRLFDFR